MSDYVPVPVVVAREIADTYEKDIVVIVAFDRAHETTHSTTYGKAARDKVGAAKLGEILMKAAGCEKKDESFEDFRDVAVRAERVDELLAAAKQVVAEILSTGARSGVATGCVADVQRLNKAVQNLEAGR